MSISPTEFLHHILDEISFIQQAVQDMNKTAFLENESLKRACVRSLEIIGEAVKKLPLPFKENHAHIDWKSIAGMRDKLIHDYFGVDYDIVWDVMINKIPPLSQEIQKLVAIH